MLSFARGVEIPVLEKTIGEVLDESAERYPSCDALVSRHQGVRLTYRELQEQVRLTARGLWGLGIRPGDRIGMWAANCVEWVCLQTAAGRIGAILVNVNPAYRVHDLRLVLEKSRMKAMFLHEQDSRANYLEILNEARLEQGLVLSEIILLEQDSWSRMIDRGVDSPPVASSPNDVVNIQYTSGTTGAPKGVMLTHRNLVNNGNVIGRTLRATERDRICAPVPLYHCFGCVIGVMAALRYGAALVWPSAQFDPRAALEAVQVERCTALYGVPTMFIAELELPDFSTFDLTSLRTGVMAGAPCPVELMKRVVNEMNCRELTICYGQTESSPVITMSDVHDSLEIRVATAGKPLPNTEVKITDPETGVTLPVGEQGELCTHGYLVMKGYDGNPEATAAAVDSDGWLRTGDLATMRPDGYVRITGRAKDMISRGGEKVYPREIEEFLHAHPKIADAYVFGIPDERLGERVAAWVKLRHGQTSSLEEIREFCHGRIAYFKIPERVRFVDSFPMTVTNKVQKFRMREEETA